VSEPAPAPAAAPAAATPAPIEPPTLSARLLARLVWLFLVTFGATLRPRWSGGERFHGVARERRPTILVVWHHQLFLASWLIWKFGVRCGLPVLVLISRSRDGTLGTEVGRLLGAEVARGSTSRGGGPALRQLVRALGGGRTVLVIPDGPRGPARELKPGVVALAELSGVPVLPLAMAVDRGWRLRSWDRKAVRALARAGGGGAPPRPSGRGRPGSGPPRAAGRARSPHRRGGCRLVVFTRRFVLQAPAYSRRHAAPSPQVAAPLADPLRQRSRRRVGPELAFVAGRKVIRQSSHYRSCARRGEQGDLTGGIGARRTARHRRPL
jgi:lysophospholipid acyltransferase (LPLAT)-like uncharacterized protein